MNDINKLILIGNILTLICLIISFILVENYMKLASVIVALVGVLIICSTLVFHYKRA